MTDPQRPAHLTPDEVRARRTELVGLIEALADCEGWPTDLLGDALTRAIRGPLSDLHHSRKRIGQHETCKAKRARAWRADRDLFNRGHQ